MKFCAQFEAIAIDLLILIWSSNRFLLPKVSTTRQPNKRPRILLHFRLMWMTQYNAMSRARKHTVDEPEKKMSICYSNWNEVNSSERRERKYKEMNRLFVFIWSHHNRLLLSAMEWQNMNDDGRSSSIIKMNRLEHKISHRKFTNSQFIMKKKKRIEKLCAAHNERKTGDKTIDNCLIGQSSKKTCEKSSVCAGVRVCVSVPFELTNSVSNSKQQKLFFRFLFYLHDLFSSLFVEEIKNRRINLQGEKET